MQDFIPYGRQTIDEDDIAEVVATLRSDWLTTGPRVGEFERQFSQYVGVSHALAVSNGTAALHCAMYAAGIGPGDEVIVPPMTFAATSNSVLYMGGKPVFVDVMADSLLLDPDKVEASITPATKAVVTVDFGGQPSDYGRLQEICTRHNLTLIADCCHAAGALYQGMKVGSQADISVFSFHPVKHITTGEGGMVTTMDGDLAARVRRFRSHGIETDFRQREEKGTWYYEMVDLGYNYRITDFQCALGSSQLKKLDSWVLRRREIAEAYDRAFLPLEGVNPLENRPDRTNAYHLYVVRLDSSILGVERGTVFSRLRAAGIGVNVHYLPVHLHPYYMNTLGTGPGLCPVAEAAYDQIISLPMFPGMTNAQIGRVIDELCSAVLTD